MDGNKAITLEGIGPVVLKKSRRAGRVRIRIAPFRGVTVSVPRRVSYALAEDFVRSNTAWILKHILKMKRLEEDHRQLFKSAAPAGKRAAKRALAERLDRLAARHGLAYNRLSVRNQKSLWGSCSRHNNISLNAKLLRLPPELMDYVLLHELLHTRIKSHGRVFWRELDRLAGGVSVLRRRLRKYRLALL